MHVLPYRWKLMRPFLQTLLWIVSASSIGAAPADHSTEKNWHQWRGPANNGVSKTANPPSEWSEEQNIAWKAPMEGRGTSSPIVWGDRVFLTTAD